MDEQLEYVLVETISIFRMQYLVQVPKGKKEYALDTVTMNEANEFTQEWVGENLINARVVTTEQALEICDELNDYAKRGQMRKIKVFYTVDWKRR